MDVPVLIVGAGPSGATTALHLARLGVRSMVLCRHRGTANTPRAHIINQRAMEVLRDAGLESRLSEVATGAHEIQHTSWLHTLAGEEYGRLWAWGNKPAQKGDYDAASPCVMSDLPQSYLEPALVNEATKWGVEFRFHSEFISLEEIEDGIKTTILDRNRGKTYEIRSSYLVGADGARSNVLQSLGIVVDGKQLNKAFNVHIKAELSKYFKHRPGSLNWILNPDAQDWSAVGNFRMVRPWNEFVVSLHPATKDGNVTKPDEQAILKRLWQMIGDDSVPIEIVSAYEWTINDQIAQSWQKGRVLCIGDAVHRHPPINGLGSNTCISDAFNLAWKLAYVIKGYAAPSLLDSLTIERKSVGDGIVRRANAGMEAHRALWAIMGLTPEARQQSVNTLQSATPDGEALREKLRAALEAIDDEVQALGIQMNQSYLGSPVTVIEPDDVAPDFSSLNDLKKVKVSTYPGYHLPHVWLAPDGQSPRVSTLDISGQGRFTLFTGIGGAAWLKAAEEVSRGVGWEMVKCYAVGFRCDFMDCYREWIKYRGVDEDGVVLVRPDHFVAWRCKSLNVIEDATAKLENVLSEILGKQSIARPLRYAL